MFNTPHAFEGKPIHEPSSLEATKLSATEPPKRGRSNINRVSISDDVPFLMRPADVFVALGERSSNVYLQISQGLLTPWIKGDRASFWKDVETEVQVAAKAAGLTADQRRGLVGLLVATRLEVLPKAEVRSKATEYIRVCVAENAAAPPKKREQKVIRKPKKEAQAPAWAAA